MLTSMALLATALVGANALTATLTPVEDLIKGSMNIEFTLMNDEQTASDLMIYNTPLKGMHRPIFDVTCKGEPMIYTGMFAKIDERQAMTSLGPGEVVSTIVDLSEHYDLKYDCEYEIVYRDDATTTMTVEGQGDRHAFAQKADPEQYINCNAQETNQISEATVLAIDQANASINVTRACQNGSNCDRLIQDWYGSTSANTLRSIENGWIAVDARLESSWRANCNDRQCSSGVYAFVYPTDPTHTIYLCDVFWRIPNERAETLCHEATHFRSVIGTDDWTYGRSNCLNLARTNPSRALDNADNWNYFGKDCSGQ